MPSSYNGDDFSCYVTIMNQSGVTLTIQSNTNPHGTYNPPALPPSIDGKQQAFFALQGGVESDGSEGSVTYSVSSGGAERNITLCYSCPLVSDNGISVTNASELSVNYYGTNEAIEWNPNGKNWGPPNNFPTGGHPLYVL